MKDERHNEEKRETAQSLFGRSLPIKYVLLAVLVYIFCYNLYMLFTSY